MSDATGTIAVHAERDPNGVAVIYGNGDVVETWGELELRSRRWGHLLRARGLARGGCVAAIVANDDPEFMDLFWACHRIGVYFTPVNWHLQEGEIQYIVDDCDADALVVSPRFAEAAARIAQQCPKAQVRIVTAGAAPPGFEQLADALAEVPANEPLADQREGGIMLYSSGTTGRPKGVRRALPDEPPGGPTAAGFAKGFMGLFVWALRCGLLSAIDSIPRSRPRRPPPLHSRNRPRQGPRRYPSLRASIRMRRIVEACAREGLNDSACVGRLIWFKATAGNDRFHTYTFQQRIGVLIDWYRVLRTDQRDDRFRAWGIINDPACCKPGDPDCPAKSHRRDLRLRLVSRATTCCSSTSASTGTSIRRAA